MFVLFSRLNRCTHFNEIVDGDTMILKKGHRLHFDVISRAGPCYKASLLQFFKIQQRYKTVLWPA